ncbi:MAG: hypothetical protein AAGB18_06005, partial [Pseudomonadota bacterium]
AVALPVEAGVEQDCRFAPVPRRGAGRNPHFFEGVPEPARAVACLSEKGPGPGQSAPSRPGRIGR